LKCSIDILNECDPVPPGLNDHHTLIAKIFVYKLDALDTAGEKVYIDFGLNMYWKDKSLIGMSFLHLEIKIHF
jgi:hypothetical protein